jgi:hypothetical protein
MAVFGEGGVPMRSMSRMGWGFEKISGEAVGSFLAIYTKLVVGDGSKVKFWHDTRCGDQAIKIAFPDLYRIALF